MVARLPEMAAKNAFYQNKIGRPFSLFTGKPSLHFRLMQDIGSTVELALSPTSMRGFHCADGIKRPVFSSIFFFKIRAHQKIATDGSQWRFKGYQRKMPEFRQCGTDMGEILRMIRHDIQTSVRFKYTQRLVEKWGLNQPSFMVPTLRPWIRKVNVQRIEGIIRHMNA